MAYWRSFEAPLYRELTMSAPVLDLGCGDGHFASLLSLPPPVVGVDISPRALKRARRRRFYQELHCCGADALPFPDAGIRTVLSNCVLEHIQPIARTLDEVARVLAPGGLFVFSVPSPLYEEWGRSHAGFDAHNRRQGHVNVWPASRWKDELARRGLEMDRAPSYFNRPQFDGFLKVDQVLVKPPLGKLLMGLSFGAGLIGLKRPQISYWRKRFQQLGSEGTSPEGAGLFIAAHKRG